MILLGIPFDCDTHWKYFCLWHFLTVLWIVIHPCNPFIVILSDRTLNMSIILSCSNFVFDTPWKYFCLQHSTAILLIVVLPGSIRLDSPFNFGISWHFCYLECSLAVILLRSFGILPMVPLEILPMVLLVVNGTFCNQRTLNVSRQPMVPLVQMLPLVEMLVPMVPLVVTMVPLVTVI